MKPDFGKGRKTCSGIEALFRPTFSLYSCYFCFFLSVNSILKPFFLQGWKYDHKHTIYFLLCSHIRRNLPYRLQLEKSRGATLIGLVWSHTHSLKCCMALIGSVEVCDWQHLINSVVGISSYSEVIVFPEVGKENRSDTSNIDYSHTWCKNPAATLICFRI